MFGKKPDIALSLSANYLLAITMSGSFLFSASMLFFIQGMANLFYRTGQKMTDSAKLPFSGSLAENSAKIQDEDFTVQSVLS